MMKIRHKAPQKRSGFTLIELLIVIAIVATLAAILFPVFASVRENARRATCQSHLKQLGLAVIQYQQDSDEAYPLRCSDQAGNCGRTGWAVEIQPFAKSTQILRCPDDPTPASADPAFSYSDYSYNVYLGYDGTGSYGRKLSELTQPALTVLLTEGIGNDFGASCTWDIGCGPGGTICAAGLSVLARFDSNKPAQRHGGGSNFGFCDGHVKWYPGTDPLTSAAVYNGCTPGSAGGSVPNPSCSGSLASGGSPTFNFEP